MPLIFKANRRWVGSFWEVDIHDKGGSIVFEFVGKMGVSYDPETGRIAKVSEGLLDLARLFFRSCRHASEDNVIMWRRGSPRNSITLQPLDNSRFSIEQFNTSIFAPFTI